MSIKKYSEAPRHVQRLRLVERTNEVLPRRHVQRSLAPHAAVNHRHGAGGHLVKCDRCHAAGAMGRLLPWGGGWMVCAKNGGTLVVYCSMNILGGMFQEPMEVHKLQVHGHLLLVGLLLRSCKVLKGCDPACTTGTPRMYVAAVKPAKSPTTPPPKAMMAESRVHLCDNMKSCAPPTAQVAHPSAERPVRVPSL